MKILSVLLFVSTVPSSRQFMCDDNLRRPGRIFVFMKDPLVLVSFVLRNSGMCLNS